MARRRIIIIKHDVANGSGTAPRPLATRPARQFVAEAFLQSKSFAKWFQSISLSLKRGQLSSLIEKRFVDYNTAINSPGFLQRCKDEKNAAHRIFVRRYLECVQFVGDVMSFLVVAYNYLNYLKESIATRDAFYLLPEFSMVLKETIKLNQMAVQIVRAEARDDIVGWAGALDHCQKAASLQISNRAFDVKLVLYDFKDPGMFLSAVNSLIETATTEKAVFEKAVEERDCFSASYIRELEAAAAEQARLHYAESQHDIADVFVPDEVKVVSDEELSDATDSPESLSLPPDNANTDYQGMADWLAILFDQLRQATSLFALRVFEKSFSAWQRSFRVMMNPSVYREEEAMEVSVPLEWFLDRVNMSLHWALGMEIHLRYHLACSRLSCSVFARFERLCDAQRLCEDFFTRFQTLCALLVNKPEAFDEMREPLDVYFVTIQAVAREVSVEFEKVKLQCEAIIQQHKELMAYFAEWGLHRNEASDSSSKVSRETLLYRRVCEGDYAGNAARHAQEIRDHLLSITA